MRHRSLLRFLPFALCSSSFGCGTADSVDSVQGVRNGAAVKSGVNTCPTFSYYMVLPKHLRVGESAFVIAVATDEGSAADALAYAWTATSGTFSRTDASLTEYSCVASGPQVLHVTASDQDGCDSALSLDVECDAP